MAIPTIQLRSGAVVPRLAYGVGTALYSQDVAQQVDMAIKTGLTFLDNAEVYANEHSAGLAISQAPRESLVVLTKVGKQGIKAGLSTAIQQEMDKLQVKQLDGYLLHLPPRGQDGLPENRQAWQDMLELKKQGKVKWVGVSNWLKKDLQMLEGLEMPEVNQIEFHPLLWGTRFQRELMDYQKEKGIVTMTYASQGPLYKPGVLEEASPLTKALDQIVKAKQGRTTASVLLKWAYQRSGGIITTTTSKQSRAQEYIQIISSDDSLTDQELQAIDKAGEEQGFKKFYMAPYWSEP